MRDDSKQWSKLLQAIAKGVVIPIVGRGLLRIKIDGREQLLYDYLAAQLAAQLEVECDPGASLDQVVAAYLNANRQNTRDDVNLKTFEILGKLRDANGQMPVPESLRKLAAIKPLRLFLSTTVDSLLANALGSPADHVFAYSPNAALVDLPRDYSRSPHRVVFQLFGRISGIPDSALIDEETLEFIWKLHEESLSTRLANFFDELRNKRLLMIGMAHPDWLARFFVRLARRDRLYSGSDAREFVADGEVVTDVDLRDFFENFSTQTRFFGVENPIEFVDMLAEKWDAFPDKPSDAEAGAPQAPEAAKPPAVFVSFSSLDRDAVRRLQATLSREGGLDVWFDERRLESGDPWAPIIEQNIATCAVFVPVLSKNADSREESVFRREWNLALNRFEGMDKLNVRFIHPVIVDGTLPGDLASKEFNGIQCAQAPGGEPPPEFITKLKECVRERRLKAVAK